jgi:hypothetical protein
VRSSYSVGIGKLTRRGCEVLTLGDGAANRRLSTSASLSGRPSPESPPQPRSAFELLGTPPTGSCLLLRTFDRRSQFRVEMATSILVAAGVAGSHIEERGSSGLSLSLSDRSRSSTLNTETIPRSSKPVRGRFCLWRVRLPSASATHSVPSVLCSLPRLPGGESSLNPGRSGSRLSRGLPRWWRRCWRWSQRTLR